MSGEGNSGGSSQGSYMLSVDRVRWVVEYLDALDGNDPEVAHSLSDDALLDLVPAPVRDAVERLRRRCSWWAGA